MTSLKGKTAVVTGATSGIGRAIASVLQGAGAHVVRLARSLKDASRKGRTDYRCDVTDFAQVERVTARILERGVPHILVNNAGMFFSRPLEQTSPGDFAALVAVNLTGAFLLARAFVPRFVAAGRGHLVSIGSVSDHNAFTGNTAYAASKWGLRGMHQVIAAELAGTAVQTTLISPGPVDTPLWDEIDPDKKPGWTRRADMLKASDVADAVLYAVTRPKSAGVEEIRLRPARYRPRK